jgi:hypothetical protein
MILKVFYKFINNNNKKKKIINIVRYKIIDFNTDFSDLIIIRNNFIEIDYKKDTGLFFIKNFDFKYSLVNY